jgi:hypothetical protein
MSGSLTPSRKSHDTLSGLAGLATGWANLLVRLALAGIIVSYGYYAWGIVGGYLARPVNLNPMVIPNLRLMGVLLFASSFVGTLCLIYLTLEEVAWAVLAGLFGVAMLFGTPLLIASYVRGGQLESLNVVRDYTTSSSKVILFLVGLRVIFEIVDYVRTGPERHLLDEELAQKHKKAKSVPGAATTGKVWGRCWHLPYCHEAVREKCPAYINHKSCWKYGYGCMCNPKLIEALVRASTGGATAIAKAREGAYIRSDLEADIHINQAQRTIPCARCPIYLEHQRQKYSLINPIVISATVAALVLGYGPIMVVYRRLLRFMSELAARFTFSDQIDPTVWFQYLDTSAVRVFFYVIAGTLFLAYVLKSIEWLILSRKLV